MPFRAGFSFLFSPRRANMALTLIAAGNKLMDIVFIRELQIETIIGIYDWERKIRQNISLDIDMASDIQKSANSDNIDDTLSYKTVAKRLIAFVEESEFELVEALAEKICSIIREEFGVPWVRLVLSKPGAVRGSRSVGVIIERGQKPA